MRRRLIGPRYKVGRRQCPNRQYWIERFGIVMDKPSKLLTAKIMAQLERCKSDEARRLILGL